MTTNRELRILNWVFLTAESLYNIIAQNIHSSIQLWVAFHNYFRYSTSQTPCPWIAIPCICITFLSPENALKTKNLKDIFPLFNLFLPSSSHRDLFLLALSTGCSQLEMGIALEERLKGSCGHVLFCLWTTPSPTPYRERWQRQTNLNIKGLSLTFMCKTKGPPYQI